jgi:tripeptidyl-peptidase II
MIKTDLEARIEALKEALKDYDDPGIILDIVVFNDGTDWRVVIDVDESGDLRGELS